MSNIEYPASFTFLWKESDTVEVYQNVVWHGVISHGARRAYASVTSWIFLLCFNVPVFIILGFTVSQLSFIGSRLASVLLWVSREASCLIGWSRARKPIRSCYWLVFRGRSNTDTERLNTNWVRQNALEPARGRLPWALLGAKPHGKCDIAYISRMPDIL